MSQVPEASTPSSDPLAQGGIAIRKIDDASLLAAAQRLAESSARGDKDAGRRFLAAAKNHGIDLEHFWSSCDAETGRVREVALGIRGSGRTAMFFTSAPSGRSAEDELGRVIDAVCQDLQSLSGEESRRVCLAQTLLSPGERAAARSFAHGGFHELARLAYLGRPLPTPGEFEGFTPWQLPEGIRVRSMVELGDENEQTQHRLLTGLTRSYEQTMDCPELCTLRTPEDVLDSHRSVRKYDPRWWWIVELDGEPEGAMLFTICPDQGDAELVYLGLSPRLRGKGLARILMRSGMRELAFNSARVKGRTRARLTCAVDLNNDPARRLYRGLGFQMTAERVAMVRALS